MKTMFWQLAILCLFGMAMKTSAQCNVYVFKSITGMHVSGGRLIETVRDLSACQNACTQELTCYGFDTVDNPFRCYLLSDPTQPETPESGVTHYSTSRSCTFDSSSCDYEDYASYSFTNYYTTESQSSFDNCAKRCNSLGNSCAGFSFNALLSSCQIANSNTAFTSKSFTRSDSWKMMKKVNCTTTCVREYSKKTDSSSPFGVRQTDVTSESGCKSACDANTRCVGFDLDMTGTTPSCWLHLDSNDLKEQRATTGIHQYVPTTSCGSSTCVREYSKKTDKSSPFGVRQTDVTSESGCKSACDANTRCVGFDLDTTGTTPSCWLHLDSNDLKEQRAITGIHQYLPTTSCDSGSTTMTPYVTTSGCTIHWQNLTDTSSVGAVLQGGLSTLTDCLQACLAKDSCVAVDFNFQTNPNQCWFHSDMNKVNVNRIDNAVNQYRLDRCYTGVPSGCQLTWLNLTDTSSVGAVLQGGVTTLDDCLKGCVAEQSCVAVDFNFQANPDQCWFHSDMTKVTATRPDSNVNQYRLDRCSRSACPQFTESKDMHAFGGLRQAQSSTKSDCENTCLNNANCQGYDFDSLIDGCFIFNQATNAQDLVKQVGTNHYELLCRAGETLPPVAVTTTEACQPSWMSVPNSHGLDGVLQAGVHTLVGCQAQCLATPYCMAIDYVPDSSQCYLYTTPYNVAPLAGVDHYKLVTTCG